MDFLLCCPRGPDHQGRHAVPEAESAADGPPWTADAEKDRKRKKIDHAAAQAARIKQLRDSEMRDEATIAGRVGAQCAGRTGVRRSETEIDSKMDLHALVLTV
jgi:hypothetical protein